MSGSEKRRERRKGIGRGNGQSWRRRSVPLAEKGGRGRGLLGNMREREGVEVEVLEGVD